MVGEAIRVTVRYRPMNRREKKESKNGVCVRVSDCRKACQMINPEHTDRPLTFGFDQVYPPGVSQADVYEYTGKPLVEACLKGFNATIFAYGQTGSGKTFSMMGVLTNPELRGIQPRIIDDVFEGIEDLQDEKDNEDDIKVYISMCEIYMERIKDLLGVEDNLQVRESPEKGIYVDGINEVRCETAAEVLDQMDNGFMNRATSATKMNPESSRSHCVTILKVVRTRPNGSRTISKIKMVDLAGSEKTSKTEATGQRLKEAMMINSSLTALSKVLNVLTEGGKHIPYRDSKLTRLLQDALGGNSKTSLICAASPCAFNYEETVSTLRFGTRAKKVKCRAMKNEKLTPDEYKKRVAVLEKEVESLTLDNQLYKLKEAELRSYLGNKEIDFDSIVKHVKVGGEADTGNMDFAEVSANVYEINKKSGQVMGGEAFQVNMFSKQRGRADQLKALREENARIAGQVSALILNNDYHGVQLVLGDRISGGNVSSEQVEHYMDQIADLKAELRGSDGMIDTLNDELDALATNADDLEQTVSSLKAQLAQSRFYKQKVDFMERENAMLMKTLKQKFVDDDEAPAAIDLSMLEGASPAVRKQFEALSKQMAKKDAMINRMKSERTVDLEDILSKLENGEQKAAVRKILDGQLAAQSKLAASNKVTEKLKRTCVMLQTRMKGYDDMRKNQAKQLQTMEQAVLLCNQLNKRNKDKFQAKLDQKDEEIEKLRKYTDSLKAILAKPRSDRPSGAARKQKQVRMKKRRPARATPSPSPERQREGQRA